jgi:hypothetical protein
LEERMSGYLELAKKVGGEVLSKAPELVLEEEANLSGCVARWSHYPTWIELHDPTTGGWHEVRATECLPGVVAEANKHRELSEANYAKAPELERGEGGRDGVLG